MAREKLLSALPSEFPPETIVIALYFTLRLVNFSDRAKLQLRPVVQLQLQLLQSSEPGASHWIRDFYIDWRAVMPTYARARYATALWMGDDIRQLAGSADPSGACAIFGDSRMIDVVIKLPRSGKLFAVDVTVVDGATV